MKHKPLTTLIGLLIISLLVLTVLASITVPDNVYFGYGNGTYFTHPGTYDTIERVDGRWYFDGVGYPYVYTLTLTVSNPQNTTYTASSIPVELSTSGNDTNPIITYNFRFANGTWLYGTNQTYTTPTSMTISGNATGKFCAHAVGDNGTTDYEEVWLTVQIIIIYTLSITIVYPEATTYTTPTIPVQLTPSGNDTNVIVTYNFKFPNATWLYPSNQTYVGTTSMTINENVTNGNFYAYAVGDHQTDDATVQFSITIEGYISVTISLETTYGGTTEPAPGFYLYPAWSNVRLNAIPDDYSAFVSWEIDGRNYTDSRIYYLEVTDIDHTAKAYFQSYPTPSEVNVDSLWSYLFELDFIGFFYALLVTTFNFLSLGIALIVMMFLVPLYLRTGSLLLLCIAWLLVGGFLIALIPEVAGLAILFIVLGIGGLIYRLFRPSS